MNINAVFFGVKLSLPFNIDITHFFTSDGRLL